MPIFSNRTIAQRLEFIAPMIGAEKTHDLRKRLAIGHEPAIAAEWEIAIVSCLARQGRIEAILPRKGIQEVEVVYTGSSGIRIAIEVTAISDQSFHDRNPVRAFTNELNRIQIKRGILKLGGTIQYAIGSKDESSGPVLGVPNRQAIASFFASAEFRAFIDAIRSAPAMARTLLFEFHGVKSRLSFVPGMRYGGGTHRIFTQPIDVRANPITSRLKEKESQVSHSGLELPSVVFLCDADCYILAREHIAVNTLSAHDIIDLFLNGRRAGPYRARSRSRRINGVVTCRIKEEGSRSRAEAPRRHAVVVRIRNRSETHYALGEPELEEISGCIRHMPRIAQSPVNARTEFKRPVHYGTFLIPGGGLGEMKIEMSLLTLQQLLAGALSSEEFARDNQALVAQFKRATQRGMMISGLNIKPCSDEDDDWVEIEFNAVAPSHLFKEDPEAAS